jgi:hypothetical protein
MALRPRIAAVLVALLSWVPQQQSYPAATGTQFDRFLKGPGGGYPFVMNGDSRRRP